MPTGYVLGVDGGGTWTRSVLMKNDGSIVGVGKSGPSNPITIGIEKALENILLAINQATNLESIKEMDSSVLGLAGASRSKLGSDLIDKLPKSLGDIHLVSDANSALAGATGCKPGVIAIAGTGSIAHGVNERGVTARAGGWGWRLGDEGSGYSIGKNAMIAALRDYDGSGNSTLLREMLLNHLKIEDIESTIDWVYDSDREPRHFASFVPIVKEAELRGDRVASRIMEEAGSDLGIITQAVIKRLEMSGNFPVACIGGVFKQHNRYNLAFEKKVREIAPDVAFIEPLFSPTIGSALLALKFNGIDVNSRIISNVQKTKSWFNE